jgi:two-component system, NarL family, sensor kinase
MFNYRIFLQTDNTTHIIVIGIVAGVVLFMLLNAVILAFVFQYVKKQKLHQDELLYTRNEFEKQLLQSQLEVQEQTLNVVSQEIHDNIGQILSLAKVQLNIMEEQDSIVKIKLREVKQTLAQAMHDVRDIAKALNTDRLRHFSLVESVQQQAERINRAGIITASVMVNGTEQELSENARLFLFRIIQESIQNILKHAHASTVDILFNFTATMLNIVIRDNGVGFDVQMATRQHDGLGLSNMDARVRLIGGKVTIESAKEAGTTIEITVPYA